MQNLTDLALRLPGLEERLTSFMTIELGVTTEPIQREKVELRPAPTNVFVAIDYKVDDMRRAIESMARNISILENSINPPQGND